MKVFLAFLVAFVFTTAAYAGVQVLNGGVNVGVFSKLNCSTGTNCTKSGSQVNVSTTGGVQNIITASTTTLTGAQLCGSLIVGTASAAVITLPEASSVLGCRFSVYCGSGDLDLNPADTTDTWASVGYNVGAAAGQLTGMSPGDAIRCTDVGTTATFQAVGVDTWAPIGTGYGPTGSWADVN